MDINTITISKPDHSHIYIETDMSIEMELSDHFSFFANNYQFMPKYKYGVWDGKIRLFNSRSKLLPAGLLYEVCKFAKARDYTVKFDNKWERVAENPKDLEFDLDISICDANGNEIKPRDYQLESVNKVINTKRQIILSPTGSGKSLMIYMMIRHFENKNVLLIVPTTNLVEQMYKDFTDYSQKDDSFDVNDNTVHRIYSGHDKNAPDTARITITTWQSIHKLPKSWFLKYDMVIGDEVHLFKAKSLTKIMESCENADVRVGTTGTLDNTEVHKLILTGHFGSIHKATTTKELMDSDTLARLNIDVLCLKHKSKLKIVPYHDEMQHIINDQKRNDFIIKLALAQKSNTLILFNYVAHGKELHKLLEEKNENSDRPIFFISGEIDTDTREYIRHEMEVKNNAILVASFGTVSTGLNLKNLHNIVFASPTKSMIRVLQSIGRGLRKYKDFKLKLYDIMDDYTGGRKGKNYSFKHGIERLKIYGKQSFNFKTHNIKL